MDHKNKVVIISRRYPIDEYKNEGFIILHKIEEVSRSFISTINPDIIFVLHWSHKIEKDIYDTWECIGFHMTDLPFGRGGHPYENLMLRGMRDTKISAFRITEEWDAGDIYLKRDFTISEDKEKTISDAYKIVFEMIQYILKEKPVPIPQTGEVVKFRRLK